ncbi:MAG: TIGR01777 family oxidoreductase [Acidimicrobiales bacterium]
MKILISGAHGLIGSALGSSLESAGHQVSHLVRPGVGLRPGSADVAWDPQAGRIDGAALEGFEAVVHLAGAGIGDKRWNAKRKQTILDSRVVPTRTLASALVGLDQPPGVFLGASAIGYYGDGGEEVLTEESPSGSGFLARVCREWEAASHALDPAATRVVHMRTGIVQSNKGGALARQLPLFKAGLGARLGPGRQWVSWITLGDEVAAIRHALENETLVGPVNLVAPHPVTNATYTKSLARALHRPAPLFIPRPVLSLVLGPEMAFELLLSGQRVMPAKLMASGFEFAHPDLDQALTRVLAT